ncbi:MAG: YggS family pyridoxal phosphate-dependent enzyme [Flavobacteriales bacterium]|nr:YggS family pyridoxal phosphate-dependent enzyme [Flavobacteriales bacterium]
MDLVALAQRYAQVKASIPSHVKLVAVSKTRTVAEIQALYDLGHRAFGENYPQELREKQPLLPADIEWHFIGHLQTNKVNYILPSDRDTALTHLIHGVDGPKLLDELDKRAVAGQRIQDVLLQVHIAKEATKHGLAPDEVAELLEAGRAGRWPHVRIRGLMGMASNTEDRERVRQEFHGLAEMFHGLRRAQDPALFTELSMGMSGDADLAIAEGSTLVRIGTAIFGERSYE